MKPPRWIQVSVIVVWGLAGCHSADSNKRPASPESIAPAPLITDALPTVNDARAAAMLVASMPPVDDARTQMEILLHATLYRAAYQSNVGDFTKYFLLEPARDSKPPPLAIDQREFALRVL